MASAPERQRDLRPDQKQRLSALRDQAELDLRVGIKRAYRFLYYPSAEVFHGSIRLERTVFSAQDQGEVKPNQTEVVVRMLRQLEKLRLADDEPPSPRYVREKAWQGQERKISTEKLRRAFAQLVALPMLGDVNLLERTIRQGIRSKVWVYYSEPEGRGYDAQSPEPGVEISEETFLYTPEEVERVGLPIVGRTKVEEDTSRTCPVCGQPVAGCVCSSSIDGEKQDDVPWGSASARSGGATPAGYPTAS